MRLARFILVCLACMVLCLPAATAGEDEVSPETRQKLVSCLPKDGFHGALALERPVRFYGPGNLYEYIDGQAEGYLAYNFQALASATYLDGEDSLVIDLYDMAKPLQAFGVYSTFRAPGNEFVDVGEQGFLTTDGVMFWKGRMVVIVSADYADEDEMKTAALEAAKAVAAKIKESRDGLDILDLLPEEGKTVHSETYVLKGVLGQSFLSNGVIARYGLPSGEVRLFVCRFSNRVSADTAYAAYLRFATAHGEPVVAESAKEFHGQIKYYGMTAVFQQDNYVAGGTGLTTGWETLLTALKDRLATKARPR